MVGEHKLTRELEQGVPKGWNATAIFHTQVPCKFGGETVDADLTLRYDITCGRALDLEAFRLWSHERLSGDECPEDVAIIVVMFAAMVCGGWVKGVLRPGPSFQVEIVRIQG